MATCEKASVAADRYHGEKFYERFCYSLLFQISHFHLNTEQVLIHQVDECPAVLKLLSCLIHRGV